MLLAVPSWAFVSSNVATMSTSSKSAIKPRGGEIFSTKTPTDTDLVLPEFANAEEYLAYMEQASSLPKGFAIGTANGEFVSVEAPALGKLKIRGTVIYLTEGATDNWAAVFTSNKVCRRR